jgi:hypothetical protein
VGIDGGHLVSSECARRCVVAGGGQHDHDDGVALGDCGAQGAGGWSLLPKN